MTCMATYVPMKVEEPRHAAGAPTSIPAPIRVLTIITLVVVLALFGMVVATMALISEIVSADKSDFYLSDYEIAELDYVSSLAEGFSAFPLVAAVIGMLACLLTLCAEMTSSFSAKTKMRNGVGVCWAIDIGFSVIVCTMWGIAYLSASSDYELPTDLSFVSYGVLICDLALFFLSIALTAMCFLKRYSACCCTSLENYQVFYTSDTGDVYYPHPAVASKPTQQPMQAFPIKMQQPMLAYPQAYPVKMKQPMAPAQMQQPMVAFSQAPTQVQPNVSVTTTSAQ
ncbi:uncharacterized protein [Oscarella lobularis]|uniref:uncharacterized protein isoform X2 n=1 Tax=Oscarella lobularis TaxID=121494 RepID=UPI0033135F89